MAQQPESLNDEPVLLDRIAVAKLLYVKPRSIMEYIRRGVLQPLRVPGGRKVLFDRRAVLAALEPARPGR
jgi:helix-turn-helix protein